MSHGFAKRLHEDEEIARRVLKGAMLQYTVLLGSLLVLVGLVLVVMILRS